MKLIDWEKINAKVVATCKDGEQLIHQIETVSPDIIISDISMPIKSGIDVIQYLKNHNIISKIIFLSAYQEFEYAKQAVNFGVVEYLLKPASKEDLENAIIKAQRLLKENIYLQYVKEEKNNVSVTKSSSKDKEKEIIKDIFQQKLPASAFLYSCVCFSTDTKSSNLEESEFGLMRFTVFRKIEDWLRNEHRGFLLKREQELCHVVFYYIREEKADFYHDVEKLIKSMKEEMNISLTAGIGVESQDRSRNYLSYKTAVFACNLYYFCQNEIISYNDIKRDYNHSFEEYNAAYERLIQNVAQMSSDWKKSLNECLYLIEAIHFGNKKVTENRCITLLMEFLKDVSQYYMIEENERKRYENFVAEIREMDTWQEVCSKVSYYLERFVEKNCSCSKVNENDLIKKIKIYIRENCDQDLNLKSLSDEFYMNPYYFSIFFKQKSGMNFKDYLIEVRMKKAMDILLQKPDIKLQELSNMVGYRDTKTFSERFKQYYGQSPKNYKKSVHF